MIRASTFYENRSCERIRKSIHYDINTISYRLSKANMNNNRVFLTTEHWSDTYTGKSFLLVRLIFVITILLIIAVYATQLSYAKDDESVNLYLDISFDPNLFMNKYDVSFELDGEHLDKKEYGSYYTKLCKVAPGKHVIRVYKDDDSEVMGEEVIQVVEDTTFQCQLKTKRKEIEFEESTTIKGTEGHSIEMPDCVGFHLVDALEVLKKKGFVNYRYEGNPEEKIKEKTWAVDAQNVKAGEKIDKNDEIILTCVLAEEYVKKTFTGLTYSDAIEKANAVGYKTIQKIDSRLNGDEPTELRVSSISDEAKQYWTVKSAEDNYSDDKTLVLNMDYNVPMPDMFKVKLEKADKQLQAIQQGHFNYDFVGYKTGDSIDSENYKKYYIIEQSEKPGTIIKYKSTITFKCKKTKAAKEAEKKAAAAAKAEAERKAQEELESKLNIEVWYTNTGDYYHLYGCRYLKSKNGPITQREAIKMGKGPCSECITGWYYIPNWTQYR